MVSGDLLDLWLYEGSKGLKYIQETKAFKATDPYVNYLSQYERVKAKGTKLVEKLGEFNQKVVLFYDDATNFIGMLIEVVQTRQEELIKYIQQTYSNVQIFVNQNWMRFDFNQDGQVSMDDMRNNLTQFYEFLKNYDYIDAKTRITSKLYEQTVKCMKNDQKIENPQESA